MHKPGPVRLAVVSLLLIMLVQQPTTAGEPYTPADLQQVVERLPRLAPGFPPTAGGPGAAARTAQAARRDALAYIALGQRSGDARYLGYAEGVLRPWLAADPVPALLLLPLAISQQARHEFSAALHTLDTLLAREPANAQAWLTRSVILQVQGEPEAALQSCRRLGARAGRLVLATCAAGAVRLTAAAPRAYRLLRDAVADATTADLDALRWSLDVLGDLAEMNGDIGLARNALHRAMTLDPEDIRPRLAYADFLLRRGEAEAVLETIARDTTSPMLLLRRAQAAKVLKLPQLTDDVARIDDHFTAAERRGDTLHVREAALADLVLLDRPRRALERALRNWEKQREFADTQLVLHAALANDDPQAARQTIAWLQRHGSVDARLAPLLDRFDGQGVSDGS